MTITLGTQLRNLIEMLDGEVQNAYRALGLDYRPRYTPVVRTLLRDGSLSIRDIAARAGLTHSAASQTVAQMEKAGLVSRTAGVDERERIVAVTPKLAAMVPAIERQWRWTNAAAAEIDDELPYPLSRLLGEAMARLQAKSFGDRIADQAARTTSL